jgi:hypothetical protein
LLPFPAPFRLGFSNKPFLQNFAPSRQEFNFPQDPDLVLEWIELKPDESLENVAQKICDTISN